MALLAALLGALVPSRGLASAWGSGYGDPWGFCPEQSFLPSTYAVVVTNDPSVSNNPERDTFWGIHADPGYDDWYGRWYGEFERQAGDDSGWKPIATVPFGQVAHWNFADYGWQVHGHVKQYIAYYNWSFGGACGLGVYGSAYPAPYMADVYGYPVADIYVDSTPPDPPQPRATSVSGDSVTFTWDPVSDRGDGDAQDYYVSGLDHYDSWITTGGGPLQFASTASPRTVTAGGLGPGGEACLHVRAFDRLGNGTGEQVGCAGPLSPPPPPSPPGAGSIRANPAPAGLAGLDTWLWLDPAPVATTWTWVEGAVTYSESITPSAVRWTFDGAVSGGVWMAAPDGFGSAYPQRSPVRHVYEAQSQSGYLIQAQVAFEVSWTATRGGLTSGPYRLTTLNADATRLVYPVRQAQPELLRPG